MFFFNISFSTLHEDTPERVLKSYFRNTENYVPWCPFVLLIRIKPFSDVRIVKAKAKAKEKSLDSFFVGWEEEDYIWVKLKTWLLNPQSWVNLLKALPQLGRGDGCLSTKQVQGWLTFPSAGELPLQHSGTQLSPVLEGSIWAWSQTHTSCCLLGPAWRTSWKDNLNSSVLNPSYPQLHSTQSSVIRWLLIVL